MKPPDDLPPAYRDLFELSGPVLRYRLLRDVLGEDDSFVRTAKLGEEIVKLPEVEVLLEKQDMSGDWGGTLSGVTSAGVPNTEFAFLRLCELGLDRHSALESCLESMICPALDSQVPRWEFAEMAQNDYEKELLSHIQTDKLLRLICRAGFEEEHYGLVHPRIERLLEQWEEYGEKGVGTPPTRDGYAALCWFKWSEDEFPHVRSIVSRVLEILENPPALEKRLTKLIGPYIMRLFDKAEYLNDPVLFFQELELTARLGITRDTAVGRWLLEELEAHQDADGWFRFETRKLLPNSWYYPLEKTRPEEAYIEWSFRAALIYKLLEYDL